MENKLSKKAKIFLSVASAITANTAVTTLLTSCSLSNKINDIGGFDKEYGVNNATYTRMEEDFEILYKSQLDQRKESGDIDDDAYDLNLYAFQNKLNSLHTSLYSGENKTLSYTIKTNVLRDYARDNYGIRLSRQSNVILDEVIINMKSSIVNSVLLMCKEYGITDTSEYYKNVETEFERLEKEAKAKYGNTDVVSIIQYIQSGMATCFNGICEELDCIATQQQLKKFIEKYSISVKEDIADDCCWDKLFSKYGEGGKEISVEDFNSIFTMTYEETDPQSSSSSYFPITKKTKEFKNDLITGYTLKPILVKMNGDPYTNTYSIDVDYTLVKTDYIGNENVAQLTAHSSPLKNQSFYEDENKSIFDLNASDEEREYTNYVLPITKEYEQQQINATYFNNKAFKFSWSTSDEYGYDYFWTEANENGEYKGKLDVSSLATSGMMINGVLLSEILNQAGKISLSGGSYELNGVEKSEGSDTKQWKLIVDNSEIEDEDIRWELIPATTAELPNSISISNGIVSWTNQIEVGTYQFCILANYKETKIQSAPITLTISSKESKNIENFNHNTKNTLFDENTIDQKLLDFVNNVNFSLDYTEFDYDASINNKLGEIQVNNFNIGYINSDNTFKAPNLINKVINNAINNDSGITKHTSANLFQITSKNYNSVKSLIDDAINLANDCISIRDDFEDLNLNLLVISGICVALSIALIIILLLLRFNSDRRTKQLTWIIFMFIPTCSIIMFITILICYVKDHYGDMETLETDSNNIKNGSDYALINNFNNDSKYFSSKETFDGLNIKLKRNLKYYYENDFNENHYDISGKKIDSDLAIFLGGENNIKDMKNICEKLIHRWFYIIIPFFILLVIEFTFIAVCYWADCKSKSFEAWKRKAPDIEEMYNRQNYVNNYLNENWKFKYFLNKMYNFWDILGGVKRQRR